MRNHLNSCNFAEENISKATTHTLLKEIGFSRKKVVNQYLQRNSQQTIELRFKVAKIMIEYLHSGYEFIFIDETGFNQNVTPLYGYARKGSRCVIKTYPKGTNYSVIPAVTAKQVLAFQVYKGGVKANDFGAFLILMFDELDEFFQKGKYVLFFYN